MLFKYDGSDIERAFPLPEVPISRVFVTFDPVLQTHMTLQNPKTFAGNFEFEFDISTTESVNTIAVLGSASSDDVSVLSTGVMRIADGVGTVTFSTPINDGLLHTCKLSRLSGVVELFIDGISDGTGVLASSMDVDSIGEDATGTNFFNGVIANVRLTDLSTPSNSESWKIERPTGTDTEQSSSGNNLLTYVNAGPSTREVFTKVGDDWIGVERIVNGGFDTDTGWTKVAGATISGGVANLSNELSSIVQQFADLATGISYQVKWDIVTPSIGTGVVWSATGCWGSKPFNPNILGQNNEIFICSDDSLPVRIITSATNNSVSFDNVSVKRILEVA